MHKVIPVKKIKIMDAPLIQLKVVVKLQQGLAAIGFKIPKGMIKVKKKMLWLLTQQNMYLHLKKAMAKTNSF